MFPYPSGKLHMGHVRNYMISDAIAKYYKLKKQKVFQPFGFDSFGLPAENAAILHNINPKEWTDNNIIEMKRQLDSLDLELDWTTVETHQPSYYKHTQSLFRLLWQHGLAYRKSSQVYWDPVDKTVLAREQVINGKSWRSGAQVEMKTMDQYYLKITKYADKLLNGLEELDWPENVKSMQRHWIGKSIGYEVKFTNDLKVFTTRIDTLLQVEFIVLHPSHPIAKLHLKSVDKETIKTWLPNDQQIRGFPLGITVKHPLLKTKLPIYVANYVEDYGTLAVMGVPTQDKRDSLFKEAVNLKSFDPVPVENSNATLNIQQLLNDNIVEKKTYFRLRDWLVSRQRYWGCPIPLIHCKNCGTILDSEFVQMRDYRQEYGSINCIKCNTVSKRETDTLDTFVDSSFYFLRYFDYLNNDSIFTKEKVTLPIDVYVGGVEHATMHLLYARFINHFLFDINLVSHPEPFKKLITQGMVNGITYKDKSGKYLQSNESKRDAITTFEKMSKSKFNGVDPQEMIDKYGSDVVKLYIAFRAPVSLEIQWDESQIIGIVRWINKLKNLDCDIVNGRSPDLDRYVNNTIDKVDSYYSGMEMFNKIPSELMILTSTLQSQKAKNESYRDGVISLFQMLYPFGSSLAKQQLLKYQKPLQWPLKRLLQVDSNLNIKLLYKNKLVCFTDDLNADFEALLLKNKPNAKWNKIIKNFHRKVINFI